MRCVGDDDDAAAADERGGEPTTAAGDHRRDAEPPSGGAVTLTIGYSAWPGLVPARRRRGGGHLRAGRARRRAEVLRRLHRLARRAGRRQRRRQRPDAQRHDLRRRRRQPSSRSSSPTTTPPATTPSSATQSITSVADLKGKSIAAEAGVVDHFLLLQGLAKEGMTEDDIEFQGVKTDAAAAAFAGGAVRLRRRVRPVHRRRRSSGPGSHVLFSSKDFPGTIPDHLVATAEAADEHAEALQKLVDAWYLTLDWIAANPDEATTIMAEQGRRVSRRVRGVRRGHDALRRRAGARRLRRPGRRPDVAARDGPPHQPVPRRVRADRAGGRPRPASSMPEFTQAYVDGNGG